MGHHLPGEAPAAKPEIRRDAKMAKVEQ